MRTFEVIKVMFGGVLLAVAVSAVTVAPLLLKLSCP